jgi:hypothetical protein
MVEGPSGSDPAGPGRAISPTPRRRQSMILGGLFVLIGAVLLAGQFVRVDLGHYGWPFFVIAPGILILFVALTARGAVSEGLAILGSIITVSGLLLLYQNATGHFESWSYGWALVFPGSVGAGMTIYGLLAGRPRNIQIGTRLLGAGLAIFFLGALFFEGVIGIGGYQFDHTAGVVFGVVIIALGALMLIRNLTSRDRNSA